MNLKLFELRDRSTFIPIFAFRCQPTHWKNVAQFHIEKFLLVRAGFDVTVDSNVILGRLDCEAPEVSQCTYKPYSHSGSPRTFPIAHGYIEKHFDELESGAVIDVEFILGETTEPKVSERTHESP